MIAFVVNQTRGNIKKTIRGNFISILFRNIIHHIYFHILKNILFDYLLNLVFIVLSFKYSFSSKHSPQVFPLVFIDSSINEVIVLSQIFYSLQRGKYPPLWVIPPSLKVPLPNTAILPPPPPPDYPHFFALHKLAYGKIRFAIQNVIMVLQSENKT